MRPRERARSVFCLVLQAGISGLIALLFAEMSLAEQCQLNAPLILMDVQGGIVGQTGTVWTIAPDCSFAVARHYGMKTLDAHRQGHLTSEQQGRLRELLARTAPSALPRQIGDPQVNGRELSLTYGGTVSALSLPPGGGNLATLGATASRPDTARFLELAAAIEEMLGR